MGRVINPETASKERNQLSRAIVLAIRELMNQNTIDQNTRDLASFIALALQAISKSIDPSVIAWEKRGYWLKADRFRMEWAWADKLGSAMKQAVLVEDWPAVAAASAQIMSRLSETKVPIRHKLGTPWQGAWEKLRTTS